ncbi:MAG: DotD/TraH family lipoprotein, partial [Sinobacterium sp.]
LSITLSITVCMREVLMIIMILACYKTLTPSLSPSPWSSLTPSLSQYHYLGDEWTGPLEPLLEKITELSGLNDIRYLNVKPANPIIIYVDTKSRRLIDILADSGYQARNRAKVTLKVKERLIQVEYPSNG